MIVGKTGVDIRPISLHFTVHYRPIAQQLTVRAPEAPIVNCSMAGIRGLLFNSNWKGIDVFAQMGS